MCVACRMSRMERSAGAPPSLFLFPCCLYNLIQSLNMCSPCTLEHTRTYSSIAIIDACASKKKEDVCQDFAEEERGQNRWGKSRPQKAIQGLARYLILSNSERVNARPCRGKSGIKQSGDRPTFVRYSTFRGPRSLCTGLG